MAKDANSEAKSDPKSGGTGMERPLMKRMLIRSRRVAVGAAIGQGDVKSGGRALVLLDRTMPPRQLMKALKEQFPTASKLCFGKISVDADADPKLVTFRMNRRAPGLDRRLRKTLKGTGFNKVAIETGKSEQR